MLNIIQSTTAVLVMYFQRILNILINIQFWRILFTNKIIRKSYLLSLTYALWQKNILSSHLSSGCILLSWHTYFTTITDIIYYNHDLIYHYTMLFFSSHRINVILLKIFLIKKQSKIYWCQSGVVKIFV